MSKRGWSARAVVGLGWVCLAACDLPVSAVSADIGEASVVPLALGFTPLSLEQGDFDGDGTIDLLVSGSPGGMGGSGVVLRGNGDGTLQAPNAAGYLACSAYAVVGDLDGNARADFVSLACPNDVEAFVGQPTATFAQWGGWPPDYGNDPPITGLALGDFEGDGDGDVLVLRIQQQWGQYVAVHVDLALSNASHGFWKTTTTEFQPTNASFLPSQMIVANLDDDGLLDVVLTDEGNTVATMHGALPEAFALPREHPLDVSPWLSRAGDLDGDGRDDVVVLGRTEQAVQVLLSQDDGALRPLPPVQTAGLEPFDAALGDLDGDGDLDVALVDEDTARVYVLRGDGTGALDDITRRTLPSGAIRVHAADLDGDAIDDVVAATFDDGSLSLLLSGSP